MGDRRVAFVLASTAASGTERRMAFVFKEMSRLFPGEYVLVLSADVSRALQEAGFDLAGRPDVRVFSPRSALDRKRGASDGLLRNLGRVVTLLRYRGELKDVIQEESIDLVQSYLEMVPVLGWFPIPKTRMIASLVSHHPKYYRPLSIHCRALLGALRSYVAVDALYSFIADRLTALGVPETKISCPARNCVDSVTFHPLPKERLVTFTGRAFGFKNPVLMLDVIEDVGDRHRDVRFFILGEGPLLGTLQTRAKKSRLADRIHVGYFPDPSTVVNRSAVHVCLEEYDNTTNQSMLEGMAAGCAVVATDVGLTSTVVRDGNGALVPIAGPAIAQAVAGLLDRPDLAAEMGQAARETCLREHGVEEYITYLRVIQSLAPERASDRIHQAAV